MLAIHSGIQSTNKLMGWGRRAKSSSLHAFIEKRSPHAKTSLPGFRRLNEGPIEKRIRGLVPFKKAFDHIDKNLKSLADHPNWIISHAQAHYFCVNGKFLLINPHKLTCRNTATALIQANLFKQIYYHKIKTIEELETALLDNENGAFLLSITGEEFINASNDTAVFPGHALTIFKVIIDQKIGYRLAHSYVGEYDLAEFLSHKTHYYPDFSSLKKKILEPLYSLLLHEGPWTAKQCWEFFLITSIHPNHLKGYYFGENGASKGRLHHDFGRTTNKVTDCMMFSCRTRAQLLAHYTE